MTADQVLSLIVRLNDTITVQQEQIDKLNAEISRLTTAKNDED